MEELKNKIKEIAKEVYLGLGGTEFIGEKEFQRALAIGFKHHGLKYLREPNIEIIYNGESIRAEGGKIDFIVFDEKEENAIVLEMKKEDMKEDVLGKAVHQAWIYLKSLMDEKSTFPRFIKEKIKGALVINFMKETKPLGKALMESEKVEYECIAEKEKILSMYTPNIEIWNINTELTQKPKK